MVDQLIVPVRVMLERIRFFIPLKIDNLGFESPLLAFVLGFVLILFVGLRFLRRKKFVRSHSGHPLLLAYREGPIKRCLRFFPEVFLMVSAVFLLGAVAKPYIIEIKKERKIETRERIDLLDVSTSMNDVFYNWAPNGVYIYSSAPKAIVAREAFLEFLRLRKGQNDRACLWIFSGNAYRIQDCIVDDDVYMFQAYSAPHILQSDAYAYISPSNLRIRVIKGEGGTRLAESLQAIIGYIDAEGDPNIKRRSLLMVTDAEVEKFPGEELDALKERGIVPYIILIHSSASGIYHVNAQQLINSIPKYGGKVYSVSDENAIRKAFQDINEFEKSEVIEERYEVMVPVFQQFLSASLFFMTLSLLLGMGIEFFSPRTP